MSEWFKLIRNVANALLGRKRADISDHIPHPNTERHFWNCEYCGRKYIEWQATRCPRCGRERPPEVIPGDAPHIKPDEI
jgi:hypothetical protein